MKTIKNFYYLLQPYERRRAYLLLVLILIMALLDMIGVASVVPFIAVLSNPEIIETNAILNKVFNASIIIGVENSEQFLFVLGVLVFLLLLVSLTFKAITQYAQVRFIQMRQYKIAKRLVDGYLNRPYSWFLNRNSADLGKTILTEVGIVVGGGMKSFIELIARSTVTLALVTLLLLTDPKLALIVGSVIGISYGILYKFTRGYLRRLGNETLKSNQSRFVALSEAFGAAKEIKIGGLEKNYINRFSKSAKTIAKNSSISSLVSQIPRHALEATAFGGIMIIILYLMGQSGGIKNALPIISLYVFSGYRLMPAIQNIYSSLNKLSYVGASITALTKEINNLNTPHLNHYGDKISFKKQISLNNVYFSYPNAKKNTLKNINISIPFKKTVGLVGATGSGKTTVVDIILGLLDVENGTLDVDGKTIKNENKKPWQKLIGYVPQHIYLADDTVSANIAFGVDPKEVNQEAVEKASKIANLHDFITEELPEKYQTTVGERGIRLSGGQRQRIGIARALYNNPTLLVLDEATSALDNETEEAVMDAVSNLGKDITIILIAHRLNTVKQCDIIYKLDKGQIIKQGSHDEVLTSKI